MLAQSGNNESIRKIKPSSARPKNKRLKKDAQHSSLAVRTSSSVRSNRNGLIGRTGSPDDDDKDDLDRILYHEDFASMLALAVKVKELRSNLATKHDRSVNSSPSRELFPSPSSMPAPDQVLAAVSRLHNQLLAKPSSQRKHKIIRGTFPVTDSIIDDCIRALQQERDVCRNMLYQDNDSHSDGACMSDSSLSDSDPNAEIEIQSQSSKKEAIAIKYSKWQTDILMEWMILHRNQPFPDPEAVAYLMGQTGLTQTQVVNWTTNVRKRNRKATCEGGKKPHHFIDFLFLAQDRDDRQQVKQPSSGTKNPIPSEKKNMHIESQNSKSKPRSTTSCPLLPTPTRGCDVSKPKQRSTLPKSALNVPSTPRLSTENDERLVDFDDLDIDPLAFDGPTDNQLLEDFSDMWFQEGFGDMDLFDVENLGIDNCARTEVAMSDAYSSQTLLPSVTRDSNESPKRSRRLMIRSLPTNYSGINDWSDVDIDDWSFPGMTQVSHKAEV